MSGSDWLWKVSEFLMGWVEKLPMDAARMQDMSVGWINGFGTALVVLYLATQHYRQKENVMAEPQPLGDHPHNDPGDGRTECDTCGKWIYEITHSCKGIPVTEAARKRKRGSDD